MIQKMHNTHKSIVHFLINFQFYYTPEMRKSQHILIRLCYMFPLLIKEICCPTRVGIYPMTVWAVLYIHYIIYISFFLVQIINFSLVQLNCFIKIILCVWYNINRIIACIFRGNTFFFQFKIFLYGIKICTIFPKLRIMLLDILSFFS